MHTAPADRPARIRDLGARFTPTPPRPRAARGQSAALGLDLVRRGVRVVVHEGRGLDIAEAAPALALDEDEAPRGQPAVVRHAGGDRQQGVDLRPSSGPARPAIARATERRRSRFETLSFMGASSRGVNVTQ